MLSIEQKHEIQELRALGETVAPCENGEVHHLCVDPDTWESCDDWCIKPYIGFGHIWFKNKECAQTWLERVSEEVPEILNKLVISFYEDDGTVQILFRKSGLSNTPELLACENPETILPNEMDFQIFLPGRQFPWINIPLGEEQRESASWVSLDIDLEGDYNTVPPHRLEEMTDDEYSLMLSLAREQNKWDGIELANQWLVYVDALWVTPMKDNMCFEKDWPTEKNTLATVIEKRHLRYNLGVLMYDDLCAFDIDNDGPVILPVFLERIRNERPELCQKIYVEKSRSGGGHIIVKHGQLPRRKCVIAQRFGVQGRKDKHGDPENPIEKLTLIEVLGNGHPVCVAPSRGYVAFDGFCKLNKLPYITDEEWQYLEELGRSFSQIKVAPPEVKPKADVTQSPAVSAPEGAILCDPKRYWENCSFNVFDDMLCRLGWTRITPVTGHEDDEPDSEQIKYRRPGKSRGDSANLRRMGGIWKFYNFSTSVKGGDVEGSNYPNTRIKLEFGGKWRKGYAVLAEEMWESRKSRNLGFLNDYLSR